MIAVALLLLPALGLLLYGMDRVEELLFRRPPARRHAAGRHLRLVGGDGGLRPRSPAVPGPGRSARAEGEAPAA
ncbi:hypothetical protein OG206_28745 [Streptomyces sp. NBC_01341]|uniref:hypothetical protein n=1 Tax=Streptomyces sp. NBC_01341 TaxID=2903831 RepID=UPI002E10AA23|nr:hypothetical protein OG206_28745 [Streptomyces sp. NBC_01341]